MHQKNSAKVGRYFSMEVAEQPAVFQSIRESQGAQIQSVGELFADCSEVHFVGCGDAYANALSLSSACFDLTGVRATAHDALEFTHYFNSIGKGCVMIAVSVKGRSRLTLAALRKARDRGMRSILVTNDPSGPMISASDAVIELKCGTWKAPRTKTFTAVLFVGYLLFRSMARTRLHAWDKRTSRSLDRAESFYQRYETRSCDIKAVVRRMQIPDLVTFVATGPNIGIARYGAAKIRETNRIPGMFYELEEFAHIETTGPSPRNCTFFLAIGEKNKSRFREIVELSASRLERETVVLSDSASTRALSLPSVRVPEAISPLFCALPVQLFCGMLAARRGVDPDHMPLRDAARRVAFLP